MAILPSGSLPTVSHTPLLSFVLGGLMPAALYQGAHDVIFPLRVFPYPSLHAFIYLPDPWKNLLLGLPPLMDCFLLFLPPTQNSLEAWRLTLTCGSTRWDFSLQEEAWRFTWAPVGRSGSSSWVGDRGRR